LMDIGLKNLSNDKELSYDVFCLTSVYATDV
jgi:hypothetical protein